MAHKREDATRARLESLLVEDPEITQAEAARLLEVSRQRVGQLWEDATAAAKATPPGKQLRAGEASGDNRFTVGMLLVAADLASRGWQVFFPTAPQSTTCDLLALGADGRKVERLEVRTAKRRLGEIEYAEPKGGSARFDRIALVLSGEPVIYRPAYREPSP